MLSKSPLASKQFESSQSPQLREAATASTKTRFRKPLVGFAEVHQQDFLHVKQMDLPTVH